MAIHFKTAKSPAIKGLAMKSLDFSNRTPCRLLDIHTVKAGDVRKRFTDYTTAVNRKQIYHAYKNTEFLKDTPDAALNALSEFPSKFKAVEPKAKTAVKPAAAAKKGS